MKFFEAHNPSLEELVSVLQDGLKKYFENVKVELADCPDFTQKPYKIAVSGLHGNPAIADVGGGELLFRYINIHAQILSNYKHCASNTSNNFTSTQFDTSCQLGI